MKLQNFCRLSNDFTSIITNPSVKLLYSNHGQELTGGVITETETLTRIDGQVSRFFVNRRSLELIHCTI